MFPRSQWPRAGPIMIVGCVAGEVQVVRPVTPPNSLSTASPLGPGAEPHQPRHFMASLEHGDRLGNQWDPGSDSGQQGPLCCIWRAYRMDSGSLT